MASASRRLLLVSAIGGVLLVAGQTFVASLPATSDASCESLRRWAQTFQHRSPTLDEVATHDRAHRLAIFNAVAPSVRSSLWQEQLRRFTQQSDLSAAQRALVREARELATPAFYDRDPALVRAFQSFWARAEAAFPSQEHRRVLFDLGSVVPTSNQARRTTAQIFCDCHAGGSDCVPGSCGSGGGCTSWAGCGPLGNQICNGMCQ
jgi:hypothetical protein